MLKVIELFGGIGAPRKALERLGIGFKTVDYVEIDKYAVKSYNAIFGEEYEIQDICKWDKQLDLDLLIHGSPCQSFSLAGKQDGGDIGTGTQSSLMWETVRIIGKLRPKYVLWENVPNMLSKNHIHNFNKYLDTLSALGYTNYYDKLNAKEFGVPQNRNRVYTVSVLNGNEFEFPNKQELKLKLKDMLEENVEEKYYLSDKMISYIMSNGTKNFYVKPEINLEIARPLTTKQDKRAGTTNYVSDKNIKFRKDTENYIEWEHEGRLDVDCRAFKEDKVIGPVMTTNKNKVLLGKEEKIRIRKLTPLECFRLMGFDDIDFEKASKVNSNSQLYKQARKFDCCKCIRKDIRKFISRRW